MDAEEIREPDRFMWSKADLPPVSTAGQVEVLKKYGSINSFYLFTTTGKTMLEVTPDLLPFADAFRRYIAAIEKRAASEPVSTPTLPADNAILSWDSALDYYHEQRPGLLDSTWYCGCDITPASGLPMIDSCGAVDVGGSPY